MQFEDLDRGDIFGLVTDVRWLAWKNGGRQLRPDLASELKLLLLVPADDQVSTALKANVGKRVMVSGQPVRDPNIISKPVGLKVYKVESLGANADELRP